MNNIGDLFPAAPWVSIDLDGNPNISFVARLPFDNPKSVTSRIFPMQDYTTIETMKVVSLSSLLFIMP